MKQVCQTCGRAFESPSFGENRQCRRCAPGGGDLDGAPQWVSIARVSNLAEVGYFADLLAGEEIESLVHQRDDFDAVHERWQRTFVLQVPDSDVPRAAAVIESEVSQADAGNENYDVDSQSDSQSDHEAATTAPWKPIVLLLLVGGLTYSVTHAPRIVPAAPRENQGAAPLWQALSEFKDDLNTGPETLPRRELRYEPLRERHVLDEDFEGDGIIDRRGEYIRGRLVYEGRPQ